MMLRNLGTASAATRRKLKRQTKLRPIWKWLRCRAFDGAMLIPEIMEDGSECNFVCVERWISYGERLIRLRKSLGESLPAWLHRPQRALYAPKWADISAPNTPHDTLKHPTRLMVIAFNQKSRECLAWVESDAHGKLF